MPHWDLSKLHRNLHANDTTYMEISVNVDGMSCVWGCCDVSVLGASLSGIRPSKLSSTLHCAMQTCLNS